MTTRSCAGFTLVELLLAMTIMSLVLVAAVASMNMLVEADARATQHVEDSVGVGRTLQMLRRDVSDAVKLEVTAGQWTITCRDGSLIAYVVVANGTELDRVTGATALLLTSLLAAIDIGTPTQPRYTARGHMRDGDYNASAVLQGVKDIRCTAVTSAKSGKTLALSISIDHASETGVQTAQCLAMSMPLVEADAKP